MLKKRRWQVSASVEFQPHFVDHFGDLTMQQLLELCLSVNSSDAAWSELIPKAQRTIRGTIYKSLCRWTTPSRDVVDDLVEDTLVKLVSNDYKALRKFKPEHDNSFPGYLKVIASNVAEDYRRKALRRVVAPLSELDDPISYAPGPDQQILLDQISQYLQENASRQEYDVFWLYHKQGFTAKAISQLPGVDLTDKQVEYILWKLLNDLLDQFGQS